MSYFFNKYFYHRVEKNHSGYCPQTIFGRGKNRTKPKPTNSLFDHVLKEEVWDDRDSQDLSSFVDDFGHLLVFQTNHVLTIDLREGRESLAFFFFLSSRLHEIKQTDLYCQLLEQW